MKYLDVFVQMGFLSAECLLVFLVFNIQIRRRKRAIKMDGDGVEESRNNQGLEKVYS